MSWGEMAKVNSDLQTPLNELLYAMDYKMYGNNSPVYVEKDKLHKAYLTWYAANDPNLYKESVLYANQIGEVGSFLLKMSHLKNFKELENYKTILALKNGSDTIKNELYSSSGRLHFLIVDGFVNADDLSPQEIKEIYYDANRTDCDLSYPEIIYNNYGVSFSQSIEETKTLYSKNDFWKPPGKYFDNQNWLKMVYDNAENHSLIKTATSSSGTLSLTAQSSHPDNQISKNVHRSISLDGDDPVVLKISGNVYVRTDITNQVIPNAWFSSSCGSLSLSAAVGSGNNSDSSQSKEVYAFLKDTNVPVSYTLRMKRYTNTTYSSSGSGSVVLHYV